MHHRRQGTSILLALTAVTFSRVPVSAQNDTLRKTPARIAGMGVKKWTNLYCKNHPWSTASETDAAHIFRHSLRQVNDQRVAAAALSPPLRVDLAVIRRLAPAYSPGMLEIEARDGIETGKEELIAALIPRLGRKAVGPTAARRERFVS